MRTTALLATIAVLGMVVGLSELTLNVNNELEDVGSAFSSMQQSYQASGFCGHKGWNASSSYCDRAEFCDCPTDIN